MMQLCQGVCVAEVVVVVGVGGCHLRRKPAFILYSHLRSLPHPHPTTAVEVRSVAPPMKSVHSR